MSALLRAVPNSLTLLRSFLAVFVTVLIANDQFSQALMVFLVALVTDFLDGYLARRWQAVSASGEKILETMSDTMIIAFPLFALIVLPGGTLGKIGWGLCAIVIIYFLFIRPRDGARRWLRVGGLEPTFYVVTMVGLGVYLAVQAGGWWFWFTTVFFVAMALIKRRRILFLLAKWRRPSPPFEGGVRPARHSRNSEAGGGGS